jgi:HEAT repeat protein
MILRYLASAGLLVAMAGSAAANSPVLSREENERAHQLLQKLGAKEYKIRESAASELVKMGRAVEPVLRQGLTDADPEIRYRSRYLLPLALTYDLEKRIQVFLTDRQDKAPLPSWIKFKEVVGDDQNTRAIFAAMHRTETELLELLDKNPAAAQSKISTRCNEFMMSRNFNYNAPVAAEQIALLLFATQHSKLKLDDIARANFSSALQSLSFQAVGKSTLKNNGVVRKLIVKYLSNLNEFTIHSDMYLLVNLDLKEGLDIARTLLKKSTNQPWVKAMAIGVMAKLGGKEVVPELLPYLHDKTSCGTMQMNFNNNKNLTMTTQLRDVALGMLVHLTGQNLNDYEFAYVKMFPGNFSSQNLFMSPTMLGFSDDKGRDLSMKKWQDWYAKEKVILPAAPQK